MPDPLRIRSELPLGLAAREPLPEKFQDKPGEAPALRSVVIRPGLNEFSGQDAEVYGLWAKANPTFVASDDAVKAGEIAGLVYEVKGDEPDDEYGFEPALKRASEGDNAAAAAEGSTVTDPGPAKASDMAQRGDASFPTAVGANTPAVVPPGGSGPVAKPVAQAPTSATVSTPVSAPAK